MAAWYLWEMALVPSLFHGVGSWLGVSKKAVEACDKLQYFFWRVMFGVPESCPKIALRAETNMLSSKHRIWKEKLLQVMRINIQDEGSGLCKEKTEIFNTL